MSAASTKLREGIDMIIKQHNDSSNENSSIVLQNYSNITH
jgi:hypothetical protein